MKIAILIQCHKIRNRSIFFWRGRITRILIANLILIRKLTFLIISFTEKMIALPDEQHVSVKLAQSVQATATLNLLNTVLYSGL